MDPSLFVSYSLQEPLHFSIKPHNCSHQCAKCNDRTICLAAEFQSKNEALLCPFHKIQSLMLTWIHFPSCSRAAAPVNLDVQMLYTLRWACAILQTEPLLITLCCQNANSAFTNFLNRPRILHLIKVRHMLFWDPTWTGQACRASTFKSGTAILVAGKKKAMTHTI